MIVNPHTSIRDLAKLLAIIIDPLEQDHTGSADELRTLARLEQSCSLSAADFLTGVLYLAVWEPMHDARRLLSSTGVAGRASALMAAALDQLDRAENWNQARDQLREIHRIAHYDLPLIPLWQTVNHFAHRKSLGGVEANPVTLYQDLPKWRKSIE